MVVVLGLGLSSYRKCSLEVVAASYRVCHVIFFVQSALQVMNHRVE